MGRTKSKHDVIDVTEDVLDADKVNAASQAAGQLAVMARETDKQVRELALVLGYDLPADSTSPDMIQRDIVANMRRSVEATLEVGKGLLALKAATAHGGFIERLDAIGIERNVAVRFMQAARKFSNAASTQHLLKAIGNQTKLFEMLVLDDEEIEELALTGSTGELHLDEVATMSVKELRKSLREAKLERASAEEGWDKANRELTKLKAKNSVYVDTNWEDHFNGLAVQWKAYTSDLKTAINKTNLVAQEMQKTADEVPPGVLSDAEAQTYMTAQYRHLTELVIAMDELELTLQSNKLKLQQQLDDLSSDVAQA